VSGVPRYLCIRPDAMQPMSAGDWVQHHQYETLTRRVAQLEGALREALPRMSHRFQCHSVRPTEEWEQHGSVSYAGCCCERALVLAALKGQG
jgi:hypothetical protein